MMMQLRDSKNSALLACVQRRLTTITRPVAVVPAASKQYQCDNRCSSNSQRWLSPVSSSLPSLSSRSMSSLSLLSDEVRKQQYKYDKSKNTVISMASFGTDSSPRNYNESIEKQEFVIMQNIDSNVNDNNNDVSFLPKRLRTNEHVHALCKGFGQVIFVDSVKGGAVIATSLALGCWNSTANPLMLPVLAFLGTMTSQGVAYQSGFASTTSSTESSSATTTKFNSTYTNGLYGYNGCLIGCASAVFLPLTTTATLYTLAGATATTYMNIVLSKVIAPPQPQWTYAFNLVMITSLLRARPFLSSSNTTTVVDETLTTAATTIASDATIATTAATSTSSLSLYDLFITGPLNGISQIYVVESNLTGLGILYGIVSCYSPMLGLYAFSGSMIGTLTGYFGYDAPLVDCLAGLWGYNSALTALGVGVFCHHTKQSHYLVLGSSMATAALFGTCQTVGSTIYSIPCLTLPFCLAMSCTWYIASSNTIPGISLASNPHSPEKNITK